MLPRHQARLLDGRWSKVMLNSPARLFAFGLVFALMSWLTNFQATGRPPVDKAPPVAALVNTCLITANVDRLVHFYEPILAQNAQRSGKDYAEFRTGAGVLAVFSAAAQENYIPGSAEAAKNRSVILEFRVSDVDKEYVRLQSLVKTWVKPPTTQPWGTRSIYFRDPDGNLVDFYMPPKA
jgi:uncharacterized glyoxalase superfamily protein PhnB